MIPVIVLLLILAVMLGSGVALARLFGLRDDPFLGFVLGFVALSHALMLGDLIVPGTHPLVLLALAPLAVAGLWPHGRAQPATLSLMALSLGFTLAWCSDIPPRIAAFRATGQLDFWLDLLVHAGNLAQFGAPEAIGRGMMLMADWPRPLYHHASLMPAALLLPLAGMEALEATALVWIPLGMLVMASGVLSLGLALGGPVVAALGLVALALVPTPEGWTLGNGFLGFAWLLETAPGTPYALGIGAASLALVVRWAAAPRFALLVLAALLALGCIMVRANVFVWLGPSLALGVIASWPRLPPAWRAAGVTLALLAMGGVLAALSWPALRLDPAGFLLGYLDGLHRHHGPTRIDGLYPALVGRLGAWGAAPFGLGLALLGTLGPWLLLWIALGLLAWRRGRWRAVDALPLLLILVAAIAILLAPVARNGDISEYRHRAGPLLVVVFVIWSVHFAWRLAAGWQARLPAARLAAGVSALGLVALTMTIGDAKRPRMTWGAEFHGLRVPPELLSLAPALRGDRTARFVTANQPPDSRLIDDAIILAGLAAVPAYVAAPAFMRATGGSIAPEAARRMAVLGELNAASDLAALRARMQAEGISHYIVSEGVGAAFDPARAGATRRFGSRAIYTAAP